MTVLLDTSVVIDLLRADAAALDDLIAERAGALANQYARSHSGIDPMEDVIAATVLVTRTRQSEAARLWTRKIKHFPMFTDLVPPY